VQLPRNPSKHSTYWIESPNGSLRLTHYLFKFPAKFHPPIVRWVLDRFGRKGSILLDPFNGSGTVQVEALARGISSVGVDIDPVACFIARAKTTPLDPKDIQQGLARVQKKVAPYMAAHATEESRPGADITQRRFDREVRGLSIPPIPNITHWFRRYVIVDLGVLFAVVEQARLSAPLRLFLKACIGSIIRNVSNADPAPVSGLEVTSVQAKKNASRRIPVFKTFFRKVKDAITGMAQLSEAHLLQKCPASAWVVQGDALHLGAVLGRRGLPEADYPLVVTSPPYCRAVEYSRRHSLEMYWLGFIDSQEQHIALTHRYLGRKLVRKSDWNDDQSFGVEALDAAIESIAERDPSKARTARHYFAHMKEFLASLHCIVARQGTVVLVLGDSVCCKVPIRTAAHVGALASEHFALTNSFSYAIRNQYMQYGLWNGDGIREEHVLILKPRRREIRRASCTSCRTTILPATRG